MYIHLKNLLIHVLLCIENIFNNQPFPQVMSGSQVMFFLFFFFKISLIIYLSIYLFIYLHEKWWKFPSYVALGGYFCYLSVATVPENTNKDRYNL